MTQVLVLTMLGTSWTKLRGESNTWLLKKTTPANTLGLVLNQNILHKPGRDGNLTAFFQLKDKKKV